MTKRMVTAGSPAPATIDSDLNALIDPKPLAGFGRDWTRWAGPAMSLLILGAAAYQFRQINIRELVALVPGGLSRGSLFWATFVAYYSAGPVSEWVIFRRLWQLPVGGLAALFRKLVSNSLLLGYLGEVYFYAWARARAKMVAAPFGAVKDVAVLSALTGNVVTLLMVLVAAPVFLSLHLDLSARTLGISIAVMLGSSFAMMLFRNRLFSLPRRLLWFVTAIHVARILVMIGLSALLWHLILPSVALGWWLLLATLNQLVSRLPLIPNKDVVFAGIALFLVGHDGEIVDAVALVASLMFAAHLLVGATLGLSELLRAERTA